MTRRASRWIQTEQTSSDCFREPPGRRTGHPDGSKIALAASLNPPDCTTASGIVDPDTGHVRVILMPDPTLFTGCVVWAPDARRLACEGLSDEDPSRNGETVQSCE
jgi:hypothetical protein